MKRSLLLIAVLCVLAGCSRPMIAAFGSNSEVVIITSPRCSEQGEILKSILEREIVTVQYEKAFDVRLVATGDIRPERSRKNIVLIDYLNPSSLVSDAVLSLAGRDKKAFLEGRLTRKIIHDRWAKGQVLVIIATENKLDLDNVLSRESDVIFHLVSEAVQARLNRSLFYAGEQAAATERLADKYGWSLRLPTAYKIDEAHASQRVVKVSADRPARMITVYWEGGTWQDMAATALERKKMLAWEFWDQDEVVDGTLTIETGRFLNRDSVVLSGTWENKKYTIGGIFATYCFACEECGRNYVVDAAVFAPGLEKLPLMRELRAILATFACCESE